MADIGVELDCLEGVRVVDFTQFEAGPSCTESLAWLGAEVVKIENPAIGDPGRRLQPGKPDNDPWYFHQFNANKKSLTLNLKSPRGLEIVRSLLAKGDVMIENMAPGTIERLGLGYDEVKKINPGIIYCQVKGFGTGSPYEKNLAFDMIAQAAGGPTSVTGEANQPPVKPGPSFGDTGTGMLMAISILGALYKRQKTGQGRRLQIAMQDAMIHYMRVPFSRTQQSGKAPPRGGSSRSIPGKVKSPAGPVRFDGAPPKVNPPPLLGQHNAGVLTTGPTPPAPEVEALKQEGIIYPAAAKQSPSPAPGERGGPSPQGWEGEG